MYGYNKRRRAQASSSSSKNKSSRSASKSPIKASKLPRKASSPKDGNIQYKIDREIKASKKKIGSITRSITKFHKKEASSKKVDRVRDLYKRVSATYKKVDRINKKLEGDLSSKLKALGIQHVKAEKAIKDILVDDHTEDPEIEKTLEYVMERRKHENLKRLDMDYNSKLNDVYPTFYYDDEKTESFFEALERDVEKATEQRYSEIIRKDKF